MKWRPYKNMVWVVETAYDDAGRAWCPCAGIGLTRATARGVLLDWQKRNPHNRFRLRRYGRMEKGAGRDE